MSHTLQPRRRGRGPSILIHSEAAHREGAEEFLRSFNISALCSSRDAAAYNGRKAVLAVLDGPTPSFLVITLGATR